MSTQQASKFIISYFFYLCGTDKTETMCSKKKWVDGRTFNAVGQLKADHVTSCCISGSLIVNQFSLDKLPSPEGTLLLWRWIERGPGRAVKGFGKLG